MTDEGEGYDEYITVQSAKYPQKIDCPACGETFNELITEKVGAGTCPECNVWIRYERRGTGELEDDTEQTKLVTDGGTGR